jgi:hypothetical protein
MAQFTPSAQFRPSAYSKPNPVSLSSAVSSGIGGVYTKSGVVLNDAMKGFLTELRKRLSFDLVVTSGVRTPWEQAQALAQDYNFAVYADKSLVAELTASGSRPSAAQMAAIIQQQVNRGAYLSRHMRGDALDFRVTGLSSSEIAQLKAAAASMGGKVLDEGDHVHVEKISGVWSQAIEAAKNIAPLMMATSLGVSLIGLVLVWKFRGRLGL